MVKGEILNLSITAHLCGKCWRWQKKSIYPLIIIAIVVVSPSGSADLYMSKHLWLIRADLCAIDCNWWDALFGPFVMFAHTCFTLTDWDWMHPRGMQLTNCQSISATIADQSHFGINSRQCLLIISFSAIFCYKIFIVMISFTQSVSRPINSCWLTKEHSKLSTWAH